MIVAKTLGRVSVGNLFLAGRERNRCGHSFQAKRMTHKVSERGTRSVRKRHKLSRRVSGRLKAGESQKENEKPASVFSKLNVTKCPSHERGVSINARYSSWREGLLLRKNRSGRGLPSVINV